MKNVKIKVCGMRDADNIAAISEMSIDYMGFIFYEKSPRFVVDALPVLENCGKNIQKVGVFVNTTIENIAQKINDFLLQVIQLHGNESAIFIQALKAELKDKSIQIWKAFSIDESFDFSTLTEFVPLVDCFLFDTKTPNYGGSGQKFDWTILEKYQYTTPFFLSGGISPEDKKLIKQLKFKQLYGLDLNSKFEISPALKDIDALKYFLYGE